MNSKPPYFLEPITLQEYQHSAGIPLKDQIILLDNPEIFRGPQACFYPWRKTLSPVRYLQESLKQRLLFRPARGALASGIRSSYLFAGYYDYSFNDLKQLDSVFEFMRKRPNTQFQLIVGKGDYVVDPPFSERLPPNLSRVLANNVNTTDSKIHYLPMGRDFRSLSLFKQMQPSSMKQHLCYCNFSTDTHPVRELVADQLRGKPFIKMEDKSEFLKYPLTREQFFEILRQSKFSVCPRGNAFDTFRFWDCLYVGTIPIVVKEAVFHEELLDLPILFLSSYEEFSELTASFLEETYEKMLRKRFNYEKLKSNFWLKSPQIENS